MMESFEDRFISILDPPILRSSNPLSSDPLSSILYPLSFILYPRHIPLDEAM